MSSSGAFLPPQPSVPCEGKDSIKDILSEHTEVVLGLLNEPALL